MEKLQQRMMSTIDATAPEALLKAWMPMAPDQMQRRAPSCSVPSEDQSRADSTIARARVCAECERLNSN